MSIKSITLENFKSFDKPEKMDFEDITILTGPNSSGKSSFMKGFMLLAENFNKFNNSFFLNNIPRKLDLNHSQLKLGKFDKLLHYSATEKEISFKIAIFQKVLNYNQIPLFKGHDFTCTFVYRLLNNGSGQNTLAKLKFEFGSELLFEMSLEPGEDSILHTIYPLILLKSMRIGSDVLESDELDAGSLKIFSRINKLFDSYISFAKETDLNNAFVITEVASNKSHNKRGRRPYGVIEHEGKLESIGDSYLFTTHKYGTIDLVFSAIRSGYENKTETLGQTWIELFLKFRGRLGQNRVFNEIIIDKYLNTIWDRESRKPMKLTPELLKLLSKYDLSIEMMTFMMEFQDVGHYKDNPYETIYGAITNELELKDNDVFQVKLAEIDREIDKADRALLDWKRKNAQDASKYKDNILQKNKVNEIAMSELIADREKIIVSLQNEIIPVKKSVFKGELEEIESRQKQLSEVREQLLLDVQRVEVDNRIKKEKLQIQLDGFKKRRFDLQLEYEQSPPLQESYAGMARIFDRIRNKPDSVAHFAYNILAPVFKGFNGVKYIGVAERSYQERVFHNHHSSVLYNLLRTSAIENIYRDRKSKKFVKTWLNEFGIGKDYRVASHENEVYSIEVDKGSSNWLNIADLGVGSIQLLTMLFAVVCAEINKSKQNDALTFLIEEPEASLHPSYQSRFIDFINACREEFGTRFVIETHSVYLIRKLQNLVADKSNELDSSDVIIYYFEEDKKKKERKYDIRIKSDGGLSRPFGEGFLNEEDKLLFEGIKLKNTNK